MSVGLPQGEAMGGGSHGLPDEGWKRVLGDCDCTFYPACEAVTFHMVCFLDSKEKAWRRSIYPPPRNKRRA